jgi:hypothetical protein
MWDPRCLFQCSRISSFVSLCVFLLCSLAYILTCVLVSFSCGFDPNQTMFLTSQVRDIMLRSIFGLEWRMISLGGRPWFCLLSNFYCLSSAICSLLSAPCSLFSAVRFLLSAVFCLLCAVWSAVCCLLSALSLKNHECRSTEKLYSFPLSYLPPNLPTRLLTYLLTSFLTNLLTYSLTY